jgi:hypothetical protein
MTSDPTAPSNQPAPSTNSSDLSSVASTAALESLLADAARLDHARAYQQAAGLLDDGLAAHPRAAASVRFRALVLRADIAVSLNDLIEARGILADAKREPLTKADREALSADLRRVDDLEAFLTHRGCAG